MIDPQFLTALLRADGISEIDLWTEYEGLRPTIRVSIRASSLEAAEALAARIPHSTYTQSDEPAADPGEIARFYDWDAHLDGFHLRVTWNERLSRGDS